MHPEIMRDSIGICPDCGMNLIPVKNNKKHKLAEHDKHKGHSTEMFLRKFLVSLILTVPVVLYADVVQKIFGWSPPNFPGSAYLPLVLGSVVFFYGGWAFLIGAYRELKAWLPGMMTLIGIAVSAAYFYSVFSVITGRGHDLFWELTTLITVMLLGHWLEMRAVSGAQGALRELSKLLPDTAEIIRDGKTETIPLSGLREGDMVFVRPGARIPSDGVVVEGKSEVNESMVTGESAPVAKNANSEVIAGTVNGDGSLKIKVTKVGEHTFLAGVMRLVKEAQASKSRLQILSDKAAFYLTVIAIGTGGLTFVLWLFAKAGFGFALERLVAVLVIACPHALGLAVPLVASISTTLAARHGFLVKQRLSLEAARNVDVVLFDKTGTLTRGEYGVTDIWPVKISEEELLQVAASVDMHSEHFISKAIVKKAEDADITIVEARDFVRIPGKGVKGTVNGGVIFVGGQAILEDLDVMPPDELKETVEEENKKGKTIIYVASEKELLGIFALADLIRKESREAIQALKAIGVKIAMITGDSEGVAKWVSQELGIDEYFARVLPHQKSEKVKLLQGKGQKVAMVGDGINDAPALTQADLGIAIGAGTNIAIESAGIILVRNDPRDIVKIIKLSRLTYSKMIQNLFWATGYNVVALPLAAGVLASKGILLQPALAALFMSLSTVIVAVNAVFLRKRIL
ncbi:MAG: heavy metal translocating P-type ATPase [Candidatus Sungiibacteriota bacterium]|uniref:Heavy metal translocating P-type ATPase n=1 Tax=Candidatus Sungiibacteriota bacterium TaxID=2750080 RepID=A0A7T5RKF9_9BACT|nr:MAG: heavy metal translocating P-type ATPase [Candidatus Sungbacteria bacterium]